MPTVHANHIDIYYEEYGQGEPLLLMAPTGWPGSVWHLEQVAFFAQHLRVITYDQRGVGHSSKPDQEYTTALLGEDALALLRAIDALPAHVLGFSMGGRSAQLMALDAPDAFRSLILAGSHPGAPGGRLGIPLEMAVALGEHGYGLDFWIDHLLEDLPFSPEFRQRSPEKVRRLAETITANQPPLKLYLRHVLARGSHVIGHRLADVRVPTLVIVGGEDRVLRSGGDHVTAARQMAETIPGARFAEVPRARHLFPWEAPEVANPLMLDFLQLQLQASARVGAQS
jgi:pimeloyl-ACP methyl ester carboxylesterase